MCLNKVPITAALMSNIESLTLYKHTYIHLTHSFIHSLNKKIKVKFKFGKTQVILKWIIVLFPLFVVIIFL